MKRLGCEVLVQRGSKRRALEGCGEEVEEEEQRERQGQSELWCRLHRFLHIFFYKREDK